MGVNEVEDGGAPGGRSDQHPDRVLRCLPEEPHGRARTVVEPDAGAPVALDPFLDQHEQVRPHGLRAGIAAPHPASAVARNSATAARIIAPVR